MWGLASSTSGQASPAGKLASWQADWLYPPADSLHLSEESLHSSADVTSALADEDSLLADEASPRRD